MKSVKWLLIAGALGFSSARGDDWRKVAFIGDAEVKSISGVVEVIGGQDDRVLHEKETATVGQTLRIWKGAEVVLRMKNSKSFVKAKGPVLLRFAPENEGFGQSSAYGDEPAKGFIVRAVWGHGKYQDGEYWRDLRAGMCLPEGTRVRPFHDSALDFYHPATKTAYRVTDSGRQTALIAKTRSESGAVPTILASQNP